MEKKNSIIKSLSMIILGFAISFFTLAFFLLFKTDNSYNVVFSDNGIIVKNLKVKKNSIVTKPSDLDKDGYVISKFLFGDTEYNFDKEVTENIVIEVIYEEKINDITVNEYTVTFNTNGGNKINEVKVNENEKVTKPQDPKKTGYKFIEWQLNGKTYDFNSLVTSDIELVAIWKEIKDEPEPTTTPSQSPSIKPTESPKPSNSPSTSLEPTPEVKKYTIRISQVDAYSPDCYLTVYENDTAINVKGISYSDGVSISASINGTRITVSKADIEGETSFKVKLSDNSTVIANVR